MGAAGLAADAVLALHTLFALYVVLGLPAVWLGRLLGLAFVHNPLFRVSHLLAMALVAAETALGLTCPLTLLEVRLRRLGGDHAARPADFVETWLERLLYYDWPQEVFLILHIAFFMLVLLTWAAVPIRRRPHSSGPAGTP